MLTEVGADRVLKLTRIEGTTTKNSSGIVDNRLFTGENELHAIMDPETTLWHLKYKAGDVPQPLKQRYTGFAKLMDDLVPYFEKRGVKVEY